MSKMVLLSTVIGPVTPAIHSGCAPKIEKMKAEVEASNQKAEGAEKTAEHLQEELTRLRRLMREAGRMSGSETNSGNPPAA